MTSTIFNIIKQYYGKIDFLDLELIIAHVLKKPREFVLAHPEYEIPKFQISNFKFQISRRMRGEPLAYILGHKEFFGLNFKVNKTVLIPRPETEMLVGLVLEETKTPRTRNPASPAGGQKPRTMVIDVGTGSGNIIISIAKAMENFKFQISNFKFFASDISAQALKIAKYNAKLHKIDKKIKFIHGSLLAPIIGNWKLEIGNSRIVILANLPYLSKEIYNSAPKSVRKFEPKSALFSPRNGLGHYAKLLNQIKKLVTSYELRVTSYLEISPEQKPALENLAASLLPDARLEFMKDLAGKWRVCKIVFWL